MTIVIVSAVLLGVFRAHAQLPDWQVELINLRLANQPVSAQQLDLRNRPQLYNTQKLYVPNIKDPFSIEFGAPYAPNARLLYYRYKMEGFDRDWVYTDAEYRRATYTNLGFGQYVFKVEASYDGKSWGGARTIDLQVAVPTWLSPWAIALYAVLIIAGITALFFMVRARHLAIKQLRSSEERLKLSLWGSGDQLWDWDIPNGTIHRHNSWRHLNEFPIDHIRSGKRGTPTNIHLLDLRKLQQALRSHLDGANNYFEMTYRVKTEAGWMSILDRGKVVERDEKHQPIRMTGTLKDITPLVAAEERLKMLATSITNISDGVCIYDANFSVIETNASVAKIIGFSREDMIGR